MAASPYGMYPPPPHALPHHRGSNPPSLSNSGAGRGLGSSGSGPSTSGAPASGSNVPRNKGIMCAFFFDKGSCPVSNCPFAHFERGEKLPVPESACTFYQQGSCLREKCKYFHGSEAQLKKLRETGATHFLPEKFMAICNPYDPSKTLTLSGSGSSTSNEATEAPTAVSPEERSVSPSSQKVDAPSLGNSGEGKQSPAKPSKSPSGSGEGRKLQEPREKEVSILSGSNEGGKRKPANSASGEGKKLTGSGKGKPSNNLGGSGAGPTTSNHQASHQALLSHQRNLANSGSGSGPSLGHSGSGGGPSVGAMPQYFMPHHGFHYHHHHHHGFHGQMYPTGMPPHMMYPHGAVLSGSGGGYPMGAYPNPMMMMAGSGDGGKMPSPNVSGSGTTMVLPPGTTIVLPDGTTQKIGTNADGGQGLADSGKLDKSGDAAVRTQLIPQPTSSGSGDNAVGRRTPVEKPVVDDSNDFGTGNAAIWFVPFGDMSSGNKAAEQ